MRTKQSLAICIIFCTAIIFSFKTSAQTPNCFWAKQSSAPFSGGNNIAVGNKVAADLAGNVYVTGRFNTNATLFGTTTLANQGFFIAKYNSTGGFLWAKGQTGIYSSVGLDIITDNAGNAYVTGSFGNSITLGGITLTSAGSDDGFIAKYDSMGTIQWAKRFGGASGYESGNSLTLSANGNIFVAGSFTSSTMTIGSSTVTNNANTGLKDIFIAKFDVNGNALWAKGCGGAKNDSPNGIALDATNNIFITGTFMSSTMVVGGTTLHNSVTTNNDAFLIKADSLGNFSWAKSIEATGGYAESYGLATDALGNIYFTGDFKGGSAVFGTNTVPNLSPIDSNNIFLSKYDAGGNEVWTNTGYGTSGGRGAYDLAMDASGNIYIAGGFGGGSVSFGTTTISSTVGSSSMVVKFNQAGSFQWGYGAGGTGSMSLGDALGIAVGPGNVYFTGTYMGTMNVGNITLNNSSNLAQEMFIVGIMPQFDASITSFTSATCYGAHDGTAITTVSGGTLPYTYLWNTVPSQSTPSVTNLGAGSHSVTITSANGCAQTSSVVITQPALDSAKICMVTVDALSQHNIIMWDKTAFTDVDSFLIYREITTNNYMKIAEISYDSLSQFVDTVQHLYFPNTGNPNAGAYHYKIKAHSPCGTYGPLSPYHNTIFMINNNGNFSWSQLYTIEGAANPVLSYILMRDDYGTGLWHAVQSVAGNQNSVTDPQYSTYQSAGAWRIETQWNIACTPTRNFNNSLSNWFSNNPTVGMHDILSNNSVTIAPNPASSVFTITSAEKIIDIKMRNVLGKAITPTLSKGASGETTIDISSFAKGIYFVEVFTENGRVNGKVVKE
ncbi:MAG: T9SS type A sorting domain-containing protein [Bacteroidota bacterium]